jgi:hypothetical protein
MFITAERTRPVVGRARSPLGLRSRRPPLNRNAIIYRLAANQSSQRRNRASPAPLDFSG